MEASSDVIFIFNKNVGTALKRTCEFDADDALHLARDLLT